jgi:hypothetical protein
MVRPFVTICGDVKWAVVQVRYTVYQRKPKLHSILIYLGLCKYVGLEVLFEVIYSDQ